MVALVTDAASADALPPPVRAAADKVVTGDLSAVRKNKVPAGADGVIIWFEGDRLLQGSSAVIRRDLLTPGRRGWIPVHLPCTPELDLIGLQPRWFVPAAREDRIHTTIRVAGTTMPSPQALTALRKNREPWSRLYLSLLQEHRQPGTGIKTLEQLWRDKKLHRVLVSLALRNLVVLAIRDGNLGKANKLLTLGTKTYPGYADLHYLAAWLSIQQQEPSLAPGHLKQAMEGAEAGFVGSGGESFYRAHWLMGTITELAGDQMSAVYNYKVGLIPRPAFRPSVEGLLNQRLPPETIEVLQWELCALVRREPEYLEPVFGYLLLHRAFPAARRLAETLALPEEKRAALREKVESAAAPFRPSANRNGCKPGVILTGPFFVHSSIGRINREIGAALLQAADLDAGLEPHGFASALAHKLPHSKLVADGLLRHPQRLELTIRHHWPPDFRPSPTGKLATIVHWEYGAVPAKWVEGIQQNVDELWVASRFVRDVFVRGGVDPERVHVIPLGVDTGLFRPEGPVWHPEGCRRFVFLFVGGSIRRKGVDLLLEAYKQAFRPEDDVTLIIKDHGSKEFYQHNNFLDQIQRFARNARNPHLLLVAKEMHDSGLASLYRGCDAFVLPYRGEAFGMPIAEAMACGKPVVTTALGPASEFCTDETGYLIPAEVAPLPEALPPLGKMTGEPTWFEPNLGELVRTLRQVYEQREQAARRGAAAAERIKTTHAWPRIAELYLERIRHLTRG